MPNASPLNDPASTPTFDSSKTPRESGFSTISSHRPHPCPIGTHPHCFSAPKAAILLHSHSTELTPSRSPSSGIMVMLRSCLSLLTLNVFPRQPFGLVALAPSTPQRPQHQAVPSTPSPSTRLQKRPQRVPNAPSLCPQTFPQIHPQHTLTRPHKIEDKYLFFCFCFTFLMRAQSPSGLRSPDAHPLFVLAAARPWFPSPPGPFDVHRILEGGTCVLQRVGWLSLPFSFSQTGLPYVSASVTTSTYGNDDPSLQHMLVHTGEKCVFPLALDRAFLSDTSVQLTSARSVAVASALHRI
jgi:hypothetical protein